MIGIKEKIDFCTKFFNPNNKYLSQNLHWQSFEYYVLAGGDTDRYKDIGSHPGQLDFLINARHFENLLHSGNGFGKTDLIARKHIVKHLLHFYDPLHKHIQYKTLNIAITREQAELVLDRIVSLVESAPLLKGWFIKSVRHAPTGQIILVNGGVIEFKTTKRKAEAVEGHQYGYISADEVALEEHLEFIREKILLPRIRKFEDGQLDWFATPKGYNSYYRVMNQIKNAGGFIRSGSSYENPHINHKLLDYLISDWSQAKINQVIYGMFVDNAQFMFASRINKLIDENLEFKEVEKGEHYIEGWDLARGKKENSDSTVGFRIKKAPVNIVVGHWSFQLPWTEQERDNLLNKTGEIHHSSIEREIRTKQLESKSDCLIDSTGVGDTLFGIVMDIAQPVDFRGKKDKILEHAQAVIDAGLIKCPHISEFIEELTTYERNDKNLPTDNVMAFCVACQAIPVARQKIETLDI